VARRQGDRQSKWKYQYGETDDHVLFGDWQICFQTYADLYQLDRDPKKSPAHAGDGVSDEHSEQGLLVVVGRFVHGDAGDDQDVPRHRQ
jgi:hypothetical protein